MRDSHTHRLLLAAFSVVAILTGSSTAAAEPARYVRASWQMQDGLPSDNIRAVLRSRTGYLWVATFHGLARFDGVAFSTYHLGNTPALPNNLINRLFEDREGRLWLGHDTGEVTLYSGGRFRSLSLGAETPRQAVERFAQGADGTVWMLYRNGWLRPFRHETAGEVLRPSTERIIDLETDRAGTVWVADRDTVARIAAGGTAPVWSEDCPPRGLGRPRLLAARRGGIWVLAGGVIRRWHEGRWIEELGAAPGIGAAALPLLESEDGRVFLGGVSVAGLLQATPGGEVSPVEVVGAGLPGWVRSGCNDAEGNLWLCTSANGLQRLRPSRVEMVAVPESAGPWPVHSVTPRSAGGLWVGTEGAGVYSLRPVRTGNDPARLECERVGSARVIHAVLEDRRGTLWAGTSGMGGVLQAGNGMTLQPLVRNNALANTYGLLEAGNGTLWIGTLDGPARLDGERLVWPTAPEHPLPNVRCLAEDGSGGIWIGTLGSGLAFYRGGATVRIRSADGLPSDYVLSLDSEPTGDLWVGTYGHGMGRIRDGRVTGGVSSRHGLPSDVVFSLLAEDRDKVWITSPAGIVRVLRVDLHRCADGLLDRLPFQTLDTTDGLSTLEMSGGFQPAACRTPDGHLWFATARGLARVDPVAVENRSRPTPVVIESLRADGEIEEIHGPLPGGEAVAAASGGGRVDRDRPRQLGAGVRSLEIKYSGLSLAAPQRVRFRYQLEGLETEWVQAEARRTAYYNNLPPGAYVFRVQTTNSDGTWNQVGATLPFSIRPFLWQTRWFAVGSLATGAGAIAGLAFALVRSRYRRALRVSEQRQAIERERSRIARDIHDDLGAGLTQANLLAHAALRELPEPEKAAARLREVRSAIRDMTLAMDEIVWAVNPQHDSLDSLAAYLGQFAQDFLGRAGLRCVLDFPLDLPVRLVATEVRHALFLAFKEALHNVIKHAGATEVRVSLELRPDSLALVVRDNGQGFGRAGGGPVARVVEGRIAPGVGLAGIRQRLLQVGGDVVVGNDPAGGAVVRLTVRVGNGSGRNSAVG